MPFPLEPQEPWATRWRQGTTPWDMGEAHPYVALLADAARQAGRLRAGARLYSAGCGHGHNEAFWARQGLAVTAEDFVPEAVAAARSLYGGLPGTAWRVGDALAPAGVEAGTYDLVFDRAMLCALQPEAREAYVAGVADRLAPGGWFLGILFEAKRADAPAGGPPFAIPFPEACALFAARFTLVMAESHPSRSALTNVARESVVIWQRNAAAPAPTKENP